MTAMVRYEDYKKLLEKHEREVAQLEKSLLGVVRANCLCECSGKLTSWGIRENASAMLLLEKRGKLAVDKNFGLVVTGVLL